jgi:hypothetical protein
MTRSGNPVESQFVDAFAAGRLTRTLAGRYIPDPIAFDIVPVRIEFGELFAARTRRKAR